MRIKSIAQVLINVNVLVCVCVCSQMVAKGKDCADLFPAVVKNVVSKNSEVMFASLSRNISLSVSLLSLLSSLPLSFSVSDPFGFDSPHFPSLRSLMDEILHDND